MVIACTCYGPGQTIPISSRGTERRWLSAPSAGLMGCFRPLIRPLAAAGEAGHLIGSVSLARAPQAVPSAAGGLYFVTGPGTLPPYPLGWRADGRRVIKPRAPALQRAIADLNRLHEEESA
jgi:hypothetical protein